MPHQRKEMSAMSDRGNVLAVWQVYPRAECVNLPAIDCPEWGRCYGIIDRARIQNAELSELHRTESEAWADAASRLESAPLRSQSTRPVALTENGETEELNIRLEAEAKRRQAAEAELAARKAPPDGWIAVTPETMPEARALMFTPTDEDTVRYRIVPAGQARLLTDATHWRPLPTPPVREKEGRE